MSEPLATSNTSELDFISESLSRISKGDAQKLDSVISRITFEDKIEETLVQSHCYCVQLGGNQLPRISDLIESVVDRVIDYAIPRSRITEADQKDLESKSKKNSYKLGREARQIFTDLENTGEIGELLLFVLAEEYLKLPQIITKMNLKTNAKMHFHGADGVYAGVEEDKLCLYWGESKIHADPSKAISECLKSLAGFFVRNRRE